VPGTPSSSIEQAFRDSLAASSLDLNRAAYSLIIEKKGLNGVDITDASIVMTAPSDYVNTDSGPDKFTLMSWHDGGAEKLATTSSTDSSSSTFTGLSSTGFSSGGSFVTSLVSFIPRSNGGSGDGSGDGSSSGEDSSGGSESGGGSSGGGGGGGGGSPEPKSNVEVEELSQQYVVSGTHVKFDFPRGVTSVKNVEFDAKRSFGKVNTFVEMLKGKSTLVTSLPGGTLYKNLNIWVGSSGVATPDNIVNALVEFKVDKAWIQNNHIDAATVTLHRYSGSSWNALPTTLVQEDGAFYYFEAKTPGFSPFAITGSAKGLQVSEKVPFNEEPKNIVQVEQPRPVVTENAAAQKNETGKASGSGGGRLAILIVSVLVIGLFAIPQVRNKVRDIMSGEIEFSDSETDTSEVAAEELPIISKEEAEAIENERIAREKEASIQKESYRAFISKLNKQKTQGQETSAESRGPAKGLETSGTAEEAEGPSSGERS
jgi:PGF-pre-PGF domain-containing protein